MSQRAKQNVQKIILCVITAIVTGLAVGNFDKIWGLFFSDIAENNKILKVSIGASKNYLDQELGIPRVETIDRSDLINSFYVFTKSVVRVVYDNNQVVAYFIIVDPREPFCTAYSDNSKIGEFTYADVMNDFSYVEVSSNLSASSRVDTYYCETIWGAMPGNYNYIIYGSYYYSMVDDPSFYDTEFLQKNKLATGEEKLHYQELRQMYKPNCYGKISGSYIETVTFLPEIENFSQTMRYVFNESQ